MNHAVWKLTSLAGIVGIGVLVVMNAQREPKDKPGTDETAVATLGEPNSTTDTAVPKGNSEPKFGPEEFREDPVPAAQKTRPKKLEPTPVDPSELDVQEQPLLAQSRRPARTASAARERLDETESKTAPRQLPEETEEPSATPALNSPDDDDPATPAKTGNSTPGPALPDDDSFGTGNKPSTAQPKEDVELESTPAELPEVEDSTAPARSPTPARGSAHEDDDSFGASRTGSKAEVPPLATEDDAGPKPAEDESMAEPAVAPASKATKAERSNDDDIIRRTEVPSPSSLPETEDTAPARSTLEDDDTIRPMPAAKSAPRRNDDPTRIEEQASPVPTPRSQPSSVRDDDDSIRGPAAAPSRLEPVSGDPELSRTPVPQIQEDEDFLSGPRSGEGARVDLTKSAPQTASLGQPVTFTITVRNSGTARAAQVVVEDRIPRGVEFDIDGTKPQPELAGSRLLWKLGTLEAGEQRKLLVRFIPRTEGKIGTAAMVRFASSNAAETLVSSPRLKFELLGPAQAPLGSSVTFKFRVTNTGSMEARKVFIQSRLPAELKHPDGDVLSCEIGSLAPGKSDEIPLQLTAARQGATAYKAVVTADGGVNVETEARLEIIGANFKLTRTGPKQVYLGKAATFVNEVFNKDSRPVSNLTIVEKVPAGMRFVQATGGGRYDTAKREVSWQIRALNPGERSSVSVVLALQDRGAQTTTVRAFDQTAMAVVDFTTNGSGISGLSIDMSDPETPQFVGDTFTCKVRVINRGSDTAADVRTTITLPANLQLVSAKGTGNYRTVGNRLDFDALALESRQEAVIDLELQARAPGDAKIQTAVTSDRMPEPLRSEEVTTIVSADE